MANTANLAVTRDFNGDGLLDLGVVGTDTIFMMMNSGNGKFTQTSYLTTAQNLTIGDFDGDGLSDIATENYSANTVTIYRNNGSGGYLFDTTVSIASPRFYPSCGF